MKLHKGRGQPARKEVDEIKTHNATMIDSRIGRHIRGLTVRNLGCGHDGGKELDEVIPFKVRCQRAWTLGS